MNPIQIVLISAQKHPWLLGVLLLAMVAHWADLNWPSYHLSYLSRTLYTFATLYAAGTAIPAQTPPPDKPTETKP